MGKLEYLVIALALVAASSIVCLMSLPPFNQMVGAWKQAGLTRLRQLQRWGWGSSWAGFELKIYDPVTNQILQFWSNDGYRFIIGAGSPRAQELSDLLPKQDRLLRPQLERLYQQKLDDMRQNVTSHGHKVL